MGRAFAILIVLVYGEDHNRQCERSQESIVRGQKSEVRSRRSEAGSQRSEVGGQKSGPRNQKWCWIINQAAEHPAHLCATARKVMMFLSRDIATVSSEVQR